MGWTFRRCSSWLLQWLWAAALGPLHRDEFQRVGEGFEERRGLEGLREVMEEPGLDGLDDGGGRGVGSEREDRYRLGVGLLAQALHELEGADAGEVDVDQDRFGLLRARELESVLEVQRAEQHQVLAARGEVLDERDALGVLLHAEQAAEFRGGFGDSSGHRQAVWHGGEGGVPKKSPARGGAR